jgi:two-component system response regulator PilR (NtrC family)
MFMSKNMPHILVVDDELSMRELLEVLLSKEGYKVSFAENGRNAVSMIKKHTLICCFATSGLGILPVWMC